MTWLERTFLCAALAAASVLLPGTAWAVSVDCSNDDGSCTVSNDGGMDSESCECAGGSGTGSTGGNNYAGLNAEELAAICEDLLGLCAEFETDDTFPMTTSVGTVTDTEADTTDSFSTTDAVTSDATESATTDHSTSDPTDASTSEHGTTGGATGSTSDDTDGTTGDGTTGDGSTSNVQPTATDPTTPVDDASAEDSSGGEGGADSEQSGCGCTAGPGDPAALLGLLALLGVRRSRRARAC